MSLTLRFKEKLGGMLSAPSDSVSLGRLTGGSTQVSAPEQ